jgi:hypothetical protein
VGQVSLRYEGSLVRVESDDRASLAWLQEFLTPWFEVATGATGGVLVRYRADARAYAALESAARRADRRLVPCFVLDTEVVRLPAHEEAGERVLHDEDHGCFLRFGPGVLEVVADPSSPSRRLPLLRAVREAAVEPLRARTERLTLHAAAAACDDGVVLLGGGKGSGKTTLLVHALASGRGAAAFVGNDRVVLALDEEPVRVRGTPTVVTIRPGTVERFPALARGVAAAPRTSQLSRAEMREALAARGPFSSGERLRLAPAQLCDALRVGAVAGGRLAAVVVCRVDPGATGIEVEPLAGAAATAALEECAYGRGAGDVSSTAFSDLLGTAAGPCPPPAALAGRAPVLRCRLGPSAYDEPLALADLFSGVGGRRR